MIRRSAKILAVPLLTAGWIGILLAAGCNTQNRETDLPGLVASGVSAHFTPDADPACARADLLSMQQGTSSGSTVTVDLVLTDCDASLSLSGVSFEIAYDSSLLNFIGCSDGSLFPQSALAPGTPVCKPLAGGTILGSIALARPIGVTAPPSGTVTVVKLVFHVTKSGISSPASFVGTDQLSSTSLFLLDPLSSNVIVYTLGASGYAGGQFVSN